MSKRPRLLVLDLLETYARERDIDVRLERDHDRDVWECVLNTNGSQGPARGMGRTAHEAIMSALEASGVKLSGGVPHSEGRHPLGDATHSEGS
jgi:hypothetical protein